MKAKLLGVVAALALMAGASSAQAAIVDVTYTGTVTANSDLTGFFGMAYGSNNLVGLTFQITFRFDTTRGNSYYSPTENYAYGGSDYGIPTPSLGATVTVGGVTGPAIAGSYYSQIHGYNDPSYPKSEQYQTVENYNNNAGNIYINNYTYGYVQNSAPGSTIPASIDAPFTYTVQPGDTNFMDAFYLTYDYNTGATAIDTQVAGDVLSITETLVSPGPTPGAGVLGLAGLVLAGGFARARAARG